MGNKPKRADRAVRGALRASIALLAAWCVQAPAANAGMICDQASRKVSRIEMPNADVSIDVPSIDIPLTAEVVDLGSGGSVGTPRLRLLDPDFLDSHFPDDSFIDHEASLPAAITPQRIEPSSRVTRLLRQIFDQAAAEQFSLDEDLNPVRSADETPGAVQPEQPAVELAIPEQAPEEPPVELRLAPDAITEFPGVSEEEHSRYRRQMYRKDI